MQIILMILQLVMGCGLLTLGAERFILASSAIAQRLGLSPLLVGVLLVGFGTSFPEIVVSAIAALHQTPLLAIGNAIGSNIINTSLVLGVTALIFPLTVHSSLLRREFPILMLACLITLLLLANLYLSRLDGAILLILLVLHLVWMLWTVGKTDQRDPLFSELAEELPKLPMKLSIAIFWWVLGLGLLFLSSEIIVNAAVTIARWLQVSELIIGLTIVAIGTSLPELAATIMSALKKEHDIALGNIIGSNIFNLLAVLAMPALIAPTVLPESLLWRDYLWMLGLMILMWVFSAFPKNRPTIGRYRGLLLLILFFIYTGWLLFSYF